MSGIFQRTQEEIAAKAIGAVRSDIVGLWTAPGYPELTRGQLLQIANEHHGDELIKVSDILAAMERHK